ncbi:glycine-rich domain-containing protein [Methylococcus sp. ANG]|uniref:glycine-rich domain-containing protein n=1 Tax=Methylococcus sp. ANG TaxID=3231903 RepID=UPI0034592F6A
MTWASQANNGGFSRRIDLTTSGSWVVPAGVHAILVDGSGGGGGGGRGSLNGGGGGGGGAAAWTAQTMLPVVPGEVLTYTIGAGAAPATHGGSTTLTGSLFGTLTLPAGLSGVSASTTSGASGGGGWGGSVAGAAGGAGAGPIASKINLDTSSSTSMPMTASCNRFVIAAGAGGALTFNGSLSHRANGAKSIIGGTGDANGGGGGNGGEGPFGTMGLGGNSGVAGGNAGGYGCGGGGGGGDTVTPANINGGYGSPGFLRFYY